MCSGSPDSLLRVVPGLEERGDYSSREVKRGMRRGKEIQGKGKTQKQFKKIQGQ